MSITIKTSQAKFKDESGQFVEINALAEKSLQDTLRDIEDKGNAVKDSIPEDYSSLSSTVSTLEQDVSTLETEISSTVKTVNGVTPDNTGNVTLTSTSFEVYDKDTIDSMFAEEVNLRSSNDNQLRTSINEESTTRQTQDSLLNTAIGVERNRINNLVSSVTTDSEVIDIRTGADGHNYSSAGEAVRTQITNLAEDLSEFEKDMNNTLVFTNTLNLVLDWEQGGISTSTGQNDDSVALKQIRTSAFSVDSTYITFVANNGYQIMVHFYDENGAYLDRTGWITNQTSLNRYAKYRVKIRATDSSNILANNHRNYGSISIIPKWSEQIAEINTKLPQIETNKNDIANLDTVVYENTPKCYNHWNIANSDKLIIPTYDGSGEATHPKVLYIENGWNGYKWWLGITPYPASNDDYENPCILVSNDGLNFVEFVGCPNPLDIPEGVANGAHNSDIHLCLVNDTMYCFWRTNPAKSSGGVDNSKSRIYERHSTNGVDWTSKRLILDENTFSVAHAFYSPVLNYDNGKWRIWFTSDDVDLGLSDKNGHLWYTETTDFSTYTNPIACAFGNEHLVRMWHQDVVKLADGTYGLVCCGYQLAHYDFKNQKLFTSVSSDGINWEQLREVMRPNATSWDSKSVYRPTFCVVDGVYHLYYSASTIGYDGGTQKDAAWGIGHSVGDNLTSFVGLRNNGKKKVTISIVRGRMIFDSELGYPIWRNASNKMWVNSVGTEIDKYWND